MHVVVVDDEHRMVELIARYLEDQHVTTIGCFDGPSGLAAARGLDVDAVVLDLMLPGLSGIEVCKQLRREGNDVPVLMLTARGAVPERVAGLEAGPTTTWSNRSRSRSCMHVCVPSDAASIPTPSTDSSSATSPWTRSSNVSGSPTPRSPSPVASSRCSPR